MRTEDLPGRSQYQRNGRNALNLNFNRSRQAMLQMDAGISGRIDGELHSYFAVPYVAGYPRDLGGNGAELSPRKSLEAYRCELSRTNFT